MNDMTPNEILRGISQKNRDLTAKNGELQRLSEKRAEAERAYNIAYAKKSVELKAGGESVTLIPKLAAGDETVSDLKYKMDVADGILKACRESIKATVIAIDCYRSMLSWLKEELHRS